jgi:hypothetical protein
MRQALGTGGSQCDAEAPGTLAVRGNIRTPFMSSHAGGRDVMVIDAPAFISCPSVNHHSPHW